MKIPFIALLIIACLPTNIFAAYEATGSFEGFVCKGFLIEQCKFHKIAAVKGDDGQLYSLKNTFESVGQYNKGTCSIKTKAKGGGLINWGINTLKQPVFFELSPDGQYKELDVEYITFPCVKQ